MSLPVRKALDALLTGDTAPGGLDRLLNRDPADGVSPAVFAGRFRDRAPVYPCITFRLPTNRPDARFRPTQAEGGGRSPIEDQWLEVEAWSQQQSAVQVEQIADRIQALLDGQPLPLPDGAGRVFQAEMEMRSDSLDDPAFKASFILMRFRLRTHLSL